MARDLSQQQKLSILRENLGAPKFVPSPQRSKPLLMDGIAGKIISSIIGIIVTFAIGDILIKRNYESYVKEKQAFVTARQEATREFDAVVAELNSIVGDRRNAAQRLNLYAATHDVSGFITSYEQYSETVRNWNIKRPSLEKQIYDIVECKSKKIDEKTRKNAYEILIDKESKFNKKYESKVGVNLISEKDLEVEDAYCPAIYVFGGRAEGEFGGGENFASVFEVLRHIHKLYYASARRPIIKCVETINGVFSSKIGECAKAQTESEISQCLQTAIDRYSATKICTKELFGSLASVRLDRFDVIDYRWGVAQELLAIHRPLYVRKACEQSKVFWGIYFDWPCE